MPLNPDEVRYEAAAKIGDFGKYVHVPTGDLAVWVNASNQEALHGPSGHFEAHEGSVEEYVPARVEAA